MRLGATASRGAATIADADFRRIVRAVVFRRAETIAFRRATTIGIRADAVGLIPIGAIDLFGETDRIRAEAVFRRIVREGVFRRATTIEIRAGAGDLIPIGAIDLSGETDRIRGDADFRRIVRAVVFRRAETIAFRRAATIGIRADEVGLIPTGAIDLFGETGRIRGDADFRRIVRAVVFRRAEADAFRRVEIIAFRRAETIGATTIGIRADAVGLIPIGAIDLFGETGRIRGDADFRRIVRAVVFRRAETIAFRRVETIGAMTIGIRADAVGLILIGAIDLSGEIGRIREDADFRRIVRAVVFRRAETVAFRRAETIGATTIEIRADAVDLIPIGAIDLSTFPRRSSGFAGTRIFVGSSGRSFSAARRQSLSAARRRSGFARTRSV